jgi:adenylate cyclase
VSDLPQPPEDREPEDDELAASASEREGPIKRSMRSLRAANSRDGLVEAASRLREILPGDSRYGDPLSTSGHEPRALMGRTVSALTKDKPSAARELGLGALQVWQALSEAQGRGRGDQEITLLFTDLVGFSSWALEAGDAAAVELVRLMGIEVEGAVSDHHGRIVKRLGDGIMAVFPDPPDGVRAAIDAQRRLEGVEVAGYRPRMRAGLHCGRPRRLGGDYLGQDVNIAARVAEAAGPGEVLVSDCVCERLDAEQFPAGRGKRLKAPGAPPEMRVHQISASPRP